MSGRESLFTFYYSFFCITVHMHSVLFLMILYCRLIWCTLCVFFLQQVELAAGDMVKIDLGCHIDGYIAVAAHTVEVSYVANPSAPITGAKADLWHCAYHCAEVATRMMRPGNKNTMITEAMKKICEAFGVQSITGTLMHQMKRYVIDGNKMVLLREEPEHKVDQCAFEANEVYAIDIAVSSGEGKPRELDARTTVFKRVVDQQYALRIKGSRQFFNEVNNMGNESRGESESESVVYCKSKGRV